MNMKFFTLLLISFALLPFTHAQRSADSTAAAKTLKALLTVCKKIDFANLETVNKSMLYKAGQYIVYRGDDKKRAWKTFTDYSKAEDKKRVEKVCMRINETITLNTHYRIVKYSTEKESEGTWHVLMVRYKKDGAEKETAFAFLKIGKRFGLGDID
jgi:hypothetical protein